MIFTKQEIPGVCLVERRPFKDDRGSFSRLFCKQMLKDSGVDFEIDQINFSINAQQHTLRGFHIQKGKHSESKFFTVVAGAIYDVVIDLRPDSPTYLKWSAFELKKEKDVGLIIPKGCYFPTAEAGVR